MGMAALRKEFCHRDRPELAGCRPMGLRLPVVHRENLSVTGVGGLLTRSRLSGRAAFGHGNAACYLEGARGIQFASSTWANEVLF